MDFTAGLLRLLSKEMSSKMEELVEECYMETLKPHHGWIASAAFKVHNILTSSSYIILTNISFFSKMLKLFFFTKKNVKLSWDYMFWYRIEYVIMKVCLKIVPDNKTFMDAIGARDQSYETLREDIDTLSSLLTPILNEISIVLVITISIDYSYTKLYLHF